MERNNIVYIFDIDEEELRHTTNVHLKKYTDSRQLGSAICDLRDTTDIYEKVKQAADFFGGRIDVLINNGGEYRQLDVRVRIVAKLPRHRLAVLEGRNVYGGPRDHATVASVH